MSMTTKRTSMRNRTESFTVPGLPVDKNEKGHRFGHRFKDEPKYMHGGGGTDGVPKVPKHPMKQSLSKTG